MESPWSDEKQDGEESEKNYEVDKKRRLNETLVQPDEGSREDHRFCADHGFPARGSS